MQYIVNESNIYNRKWLYEYVISKYNLESKDSKYNIINDTFPIVIDLDENILWVCKSITCLACASQNNKIISLDELITYLGNYHTII